MGSNNDNRKQARLIALITALFFFWGLANNMTGVLQKAFGRIMDIGDWQMAVIESAFSAAYLLFALPSAYFIFRNTYKGAVLLGLGLYSVGAMLFFPASNMASPYFYIFAIYTMAGGCVILETVANPYIMSFGKDFRDSVFRLNLAQSFNPLGSIIGILLGNAMIASNLAFDGGSGDSEIIHENLDSITMLYAALGEVLILFLVVLLFISMPVRGCLAHEGRRSLADLRESLSRVVKSRRFSGGVVAEFLYVGAQTGTWGYIAKVTSETEGFGPGMGTAIFVAAMCAFGAFRFIFTALMRKIHCHSLLLFAAVMASVLSLLVVFGVGAQVVAGLVMASAMMSLMFPTIFGSALEKAGSDTQAGSALLIMAISGGFLILPFQDYIAETHGAQMSYIVPSLCFAGIAIYAAGLVLSEKKK